LKSFFAGFVGAVATVILTPILGNPVAAAAVGGAISGAIFGAMDGGLGGALKGAAMGFAIGGIAGTLGAIDPSGSLLTAGLIGGAVSSGIASGGEGLANFAAGTAGAITGHTITNALLGKSTVKTIKHGSANKSNTATETEAGQTISLGQIQESQDVMVAGSRNPALARLRGGEIIAASAQTGKIGNVFYSGILGAQEGESFGSYYTRFKANYASHFAYSEAFSILSIPSMIGELASNTLTVGGKMITSSLAVNALLNPKAGINYTVGLFRAYSGFVAVSKITAAGTALGIGAATYRAGLKVNAWLSYRSTYVW